MMDIAIWVLQGLIAALFLLAGTGKITGSPMHKENFAKWRLPQGFRVVTGWVEVITAILLIIGYWYVEFVLIGALLVVAVGIGGTLTHLRVKDPLKDTITIFVIGVLGVILTILVL